VKVKYRIKNKIMFPAVLYGLETWSLTVREEHRLWVLRRIFGPRRNGVAIGWRKLKNVEVQNFYSSSSIIRIVKSKRMSLTGHVARMGRRRKNRRRRRRRRMHTGYC
jgi:hypothetical protein